MITRSIERVEEAISDKLRSTPGSQQYGLSRIIRGDRYARFELDPVQYQLLANEWLLPQLMKEGRPKEQSPLEATLLQRGSRRVFGVTLNRNARDPFSCYLELPAGRVRVDCGILTYNHSWLWPCSIEDRDRLVAATISVINSLVPRR